MDENKSSSGLYGALRTSVMDLFDIGPWVALTVLAFATFVFVGGILFFIRSAPPKRISMAAGPEQSMFFDKAILYKQALKAQGVQFDLIPTKGSMENLDLITGQNPKADVAIVQSGAIDKDHDLSKVFSLGSIGNQPLFVFYRGEEVDQLIRFKGQRLAVGNNGSGTHKLVMRLLELNGITQKTNDETPLLELQGKKAIKAFLKKEVDVVFLMGEKIQAKDIRPLFSEPGVRIFNFKRQAKAYAKKIHYLNLFEIPEGVIDFKNNAPPTAVTLVGPTVELIVTDKLHPAISDLLLDAAIHIHHKPGLFQKRGEFPLALSQTIPLSSDAERFYKSGKTFLYRFLPFGIASLLSRFLFVLFPVLVVTIPILKVVPWLFRLRNQLRIRHLYKVLMQIEQKYRREKSEAERLLLYGQFEAIENKVCQMRIRSAYADQFYHLRSHIDYVRRLMNRSPKVI